MNTEQKTIGQEAAEKIMHEFGAPPSTVKVTIGILAAIIDATIKERKSAERKEEILAECREGSDETLTSSIKER